MKKIVTRFAVSPTGEFHIGGARTALFSYLFARRHNGSFVLRIDDTDRNRYVEGSIDRIKEGLSWMGLEWDKERTQSDYTDHYRECAEELVRKGHAYYCFCSHERLEKMRAFQEQNGFPQKYDRTCLRYTPEEVQKLKDEKTPFVIRMKIPDDEIIEFNDEIKGDVKIPSYTLDDQILIKNDGFATYHLANVIDDHELGITHVVRGDEWVPSTPKHILLYRYFGWEPPSHAHLPLILRAGGGKISKRKDGDIVWVETYRKKGYARDAFINFLAFLGWNDGTDNEIFSHDELIKSFDLSRIQKAGAIFNIEKLNWYSGYYIREYAKEKDLSNNEFYRNWEKALRARHSDILFDCEKAFKFIYSERIACIDDSFSDEFNYLFSDPVLTGEQLVFKKSSLENTKKGFACVIEFLKNYKGSWNDPVVLHDLCAALVVEKGFSLGDALWPWRVSLTGKDKSPSAAHVAVVIGKEATLHRVENAFLKL